MYKYRNILLNSFINFLSRSALRRFSIKNRVFRLFTMNVDDGSDNHWRGVPLTELYGSESPWGAPEFPLVAPSYNHAVLYHIPSSGCVASDKPPQPRIGQDKWDSEHVRMPCSSHSLYPVDDGSGETHLKRRWEMVEKALSKPLRNSHDLANAIISYNTKFRNIWKFKALHKLFNEYLEEEESQYFFDVTLPEIAKLALSLPKLVQTPIPLLKQNKNRSISLSQQQVACLLANAFFCTFPRRNSRKSFSEYSSYPYINFNTYSLYEATDSDANLEKLKCICHYFRRVVTKVPVGTLTFSRRVVAARSCPAWPRSRRALAAVPLHVDSRNTIEDADGLIQVDFANKYLGGGVLGHGCVQEEIRFVICPELLLSMLFTEELKANEALMIIGAERYSRYVGYGSSFAWAGDFPDGTPRDSSARRRCAVLAIDAVPYNTVLKEFRKENITRELNKAWIGVSFDTDGQGDGALRLPGVATGNWGCGAFGGSARLKSLLQLMACAQARRPMAYYTFGDHALRDDIVHVYNLLARYNITVGQLYKHIVNFSEKQKDVVQGRLHAYLEHVVKGIKPPSPGHGDEKMDTSITDSTSETVVEIESSSNDSPDLFSQDEMEQSLIEATLQMEKANEEKDEKTNQRTGARAVTTSCDAEQLPADTKRKIEEAASSLVCNKLRATDKRTNKQDNNDAEDSSSTLQSLFDTMQQMNEGPIPSSSSSSGATDKQIIIRKTEERTCNTRQSFFDAMQKIEEEPNSSVSSPLRGNRNKNVTLNDPNLSMERKQKSEPTIELKKKMAKKITDYFNKKSI